MMMYLVITMKRRKIRIAALMMMYLHTLNDSTDTTNRTWRMSDILTTRCELPFELGYPLLLSSLPPDLIDEVRDDPDALPDARTFRCGFALHPDPVLEVFPIDDVPGTEAFVPQVGVHRGPETLVLDVIEGTDILDIQTFPGQAFGEVLEDVCCNILPPLDLVPFDDSLDVHETVLPYRVDLDGLHRVVVRHLPCGRILAQLT